MNKSTVRGVLPWAGPEWRVGLSECRQGVGGRAAGGVR